MCIPEILVTRRRTVHGDDAALLRLPTSHSLAAWWVPRSAIATAAATSTTAAIVAAGLLHPISGNLPIKQRYGIARREVRTEETPIRPATLTADRSGRETL